MIKMPSKPDSQLLTAIGKRMKELFDGGLTGKELWVSREAYQEIWDFRFRIFIDRDEWGIPTHIFGMPITIIEEQEFDFVVKT